MCNTEDFKELANMIHHISLPLRVRYVYCCAPVDRKQQFVCAMFTKVSSIQVCNFGFFFSFADLIRNSLEFV